MRNIVTSHVVTQSISELRKSLRDGDDGHIDYIITVPKRGYQLTAEVTWLDETEENQTPEAPVVSPAPRLRRQTRQRPRDSKRNAAGTPTSGLSLPSCFRWAC